MLIYRQMRVLAGPHPDLDDLVQTALEQALLAKYEGRSKYNTFTHSICYRVWLKHLRFRYRFFARFEFSGTQSEPESTEEAPDHRLRTIERYARLYHALDQVSPKLRAAVSLHDIAGVEIEQVAEIVDAKIGTVRSRLRDGRRCLAELLKSDPYFKDERLTP